VSKTGASKFQQRIFNLSAAVFAILFSITAFGTPAELNPKLSAIKIKNFGHINDKYYRGAQPKGQDYTDLATLGVRAVVNLTNGDGPKDEQALVERAGMKYYQIPMSARVKPTAANISDFLKIANDPANQPIYVHCAGGRHRTGVMTAVYRMTQDRWTADQAFSEMKSYDYGPVFLHPEFKSFVYDYSGHIDRTPPVMTAQEKPAVPGSATVTAINVAPAKSNETVVPAQSSAPAKTDETAPVANQ